MRKNLGPKTYLYPLPVLILGTYDENGNANAMNAAWGGIYDTNQVFICLSSDHKTTFNLLKSKEMTVSFADADHVVEADYVGIASGNKEDKITKANLHPFKAENVNAPLFEEFKLSLECRVNKLNEEDGTTYVVLDILNVSADESILTNGKVDVSKLKPIAFDPANSFYYQLGEKVGNAFKDGLKIK